jgi:hypothetical protein
MGGITCEWNSGTYLCTPSSLKRGMTLSMGGFMEEIRLTLSIRSSLLAGSQPKSGQTVIYADRNYRILQVDTEPGAFVELDLGDVHQ